MTEKTAKVFSFPGTNASDATSEKPRERVVQDFSKELAELLTKAIEKDSVPISEILYLLQLNTHALFLESLESTYSDGDADE